MYCTKKIVKKKIIILIIIIILICAFVILSHNFKNNEIEDKKNAEVVLETYGGVPYEWRYNIDNSNLVRITEKTENMSEPDVEGGQFLIHYIFDGIKPGKTYIKFNYVDFREDDKIEKTEIYEVIVDEKLNVQINLLYAIDVSSIWDLKVKLNTKNISSYKLDYSMKDESIVKVTDYKESNIDEDGKLEEFVFEGLNEGKTTIQLDYIDLSNNRIIKTEMYELIVDDELRMSIK